MQPTQNEASCMLFTAVAKRKTLYIRLSNAAPPRLRLDPARQVVRAGDSASVDCIAESGDAPINLGWSVTAG